jgi:hypothetical protein
VDTKPGERSSAAWKALIVAAALGMTATSFAVTLLALEWAVPRPARSSLTGNPAGTASTSFVMAGYAGSMTPGASGNILIEIKTSGGGQGCRAQIAYGTGSPSGSGAPATGTVVGDPATVFSATNTVPFTLQSRVSGLKQGTTYWYDAQFEVYGNGANTCYLQAASLSAVEQ